MGGRKGMKSAGVAALVCGAVFAVTQFLVSSYVGPYLTAILSSLSAMGAMVVMCIMRRKPGEPPRTGRHSAGAMVLAWSPYIFLIIFVLLLNGDQIVLPKPFDVLWPTAKLAALKAFLNHATWVFGWPGLHNLVMKMPPVVKAQAQYAASYTFNPLTTSGTAALYAVFASAILSARFAVQAGADRLDDHETARSADGHHRQRAGAGLPDELLRRHGHPGPDASRPAAGSFRSSAPCSAGLACS